MKLNEHTVIKGSLVMLVPYEFYHVQKYHEWMNSIELQGLTASEPLSLEDEFNMQESWRTDPDKCTFIVLDKKIFEESKNEIKAMVGDTNFFLSKRDNQTIAEVEIMIAEVSARGKGFGKEALLLMLRYGIENLKINTFEAKIGMSNDKSMSLFSSIGFEKVCENQVFKEITFQKSVDSNWIEWINEKTSFYVKNERNRNNLCISN